MILIKKQIDFNFKYTKITYVSLIFDWTGLGTFWFKSLAFALMSSLASAALAAISYPGSYPGGLTTASLLTWAGTSATCCLGTCSVPGALFSKLESVFCFWLVVAQQFPIQKNLLVNVYKKARIAND